MEINDFKSIWKKANDQEKSGYWVSDEDIRVMLKKKSRAAIADVKKELKNKARMTAGFTVFAMLVGVLSISEPDLDFGVTNLLPTGAAYGIVLITMSLAMAAISINVRVRLKEINLFIESADPLKKSLLRTRAILGKIIDVGVLSDTIVTPLVLIFIIVIKVYDKTPFAFDIRLLYLLIGTVILVYGFYYLSKYMMNRKFGHFVKALDARIDELTAFESEESEII